MAPAFVDRRDAGRRLAGLLGDLVAPRPPQQGGAAGGEAVDDVVVLGLPRGGVPVAAEVAAALGADLDVLVVGKVGVPGHEELALAAVADDGTVALNTSVMAAVGMTEADVDALARRQAEALVRRAAGFRGGRAPVAVAGRIAIVVDDGMATGATMRVAVEVARRRRPRRLVAAVPVASPEAATSLRRVVDRVVCVATPPGFRAVGHWYADFTQVGDHEVRDLLAAAAERTAAVAGTGGQDRAPGPEPAGGEGGGGGRRGDGPGDGDGGSAVSGGGRGDGPGGGDGGGAVSGGGPRPPG
jgi:predicted phosphoribosyltransferase